MDVVDNLKAGVNPGRRITLLQWRQSLEADAQQLKQLRSARVPSENQNAEKTTELVEAMKAFGAPKLKVSAALAGLLANIDTDDTDVHFICSVGGESYRGRRPALSEVHFERFCASSSLNQIYRRFKRVLIVLGRRASVDSVAECLLSWREQSETDRYFLDKAIVEDWQRKYGTSDR